MTGLSVRLAQVPVMMNALLSMGSATAVALPVVGMMKKLVLTVLLPIAIGKAIASSGPGAKVSRPPLHMLSHADRT